MIEHGKIEIVTSVIEKETITIQQALIIEPVELDIEFKPSALNCSVDDFNFISLAEIKRYPPYLSIESKEAYLFFNVKCINKGNFVLRFGRSLHIAGWVNNNFVYCANTDNQKDIKLMKLNQGDNYFFLQIKHIEGISLPINFTLRIDPYETLMQSSEWELLEDYFEENVTNKITLMRCKTNNCGKFNFYIVPLDYSNSMKNVSFNFEIPDGKNVLLRTKAKIYEIISYVHQENKIESTFMHIDVNYEINSTLHVKRDIFLLKKNLANLIETRKKWLNKICLNREEYDLQLPGYINQYKYIPELTDDIDYKNFVYNEIIKSQQCNLSRETSNYIEWIKAEGGLYPISFYLKLDNSIYTYSILLPDNYDSSHQYPLMVVFPYFDDRPDLLGTMFFKKYNDPMIEDFISVVVNPLGHTMGSYMGDTAVMDCINHVKSNFSIDENKIYGMGFSLGSYTTFTIAQNYPDLFAALFICSGEYISKTIENIKHIPMVYISSNSDQNFAKQKYDEISKYDSFKNVIYYNTQHDYHRALSLYFTHICKKTILYLLSHEKTQPNKLTLKMQRMKYNKAFNVEILESKNYKNLSSVSYEIIDKQINLQAINVNKFRLNISEEFKKRFSSINVLNNNVPYFDKENMDFVFKISDSENIKYRKYNPEKDSVLALQHINIGTLYVYMNAMEVVYSQNENDIVALVRKFQNPVLFMQNDPHISVSYPERYTSSLKDALSQNKNLIIIQYGGKAELMEQLKSHYKLNFDFHGCYFDGEYHEGDYSILKLFPHPFNADNRVLLIYANAIDQFKRNIYLRRVSIPSYTYGLHPLNEDSIICFNNKYYSDSKPLGR